jgi:putative NADH-flavin reductase
MPRDDKHFVYFTVAVLRDGTLHKDIEQEAKRRGLNQFAVAIRAMLEDYLTLKRSMMSLDDVKEALRGMAVVQATNVNMPQHTNSTDNDDESNAAEADSAWEK